MTSLAWLTFLPLLGALVVAAAPARASLLRAITLGTTLVVALMGVAVYASFDVTQSGPQFVTEAAWFTLLGGIDVHFKLGVDGLSILMVALTTVLMPLIVLSTKGHIHSRVKEFMIWLLVMETGMLGVFLSLDLVLFYFFWEVSLVPLYFILGIWGGERRLYATVKFFLYTVAGSLVMLIAAIALIYHASLQNAVSTTDIGALTRWSANQPLAVQGWLFAGFALAFAIKVPVLPFHTWLADAHTEAPTSGSVILAGVLLKMGTYGLLRFGLAMFPAASVAASPLFMVLGALGIVYGAFLAMAQTDIKRLVACSSVSHLGYVIVGLFALERTGVTGSVLQMVNHGLSTGLLFLLIGMVYERRHTRNLDDFGGLAASMPVFAFLFVFAVLSSAGLPGLNGFVGEWLILLGSFQAAPWVACISVLGVVFGAVYLLMATRKMLFGPLDRDENRAVSDVTGRELLIAAPIVALCIWIGVGPQSFLGRTEKSLEVVFERLDAARSSLELGRFDTPHTRRETGEVR